MRLIERLIGVLLLLAPALSAAGGEKKSSETSDAGGDSLGVLLVTCTPGGEIYQYYGHTALWVQNYSTHGDVVFDYGVFDFDSPNFILRFVLGETDYTIGGSDAGSFFYHWKQRGCTVTADRLQLTAEEKRRLVAAVTSDYETPGWTYRYNFFYDNCATRVRDLIEKSIDGHIVYADSIEPQSFRDIVHRHSAGYEWSTFGQDLLLGARADKGTTRREQQFAPLIMRQTLASAMVERDGVRTALVDETFKTDQGYRDANREAAVEADRSKFPSPMKCAVALLVLTLLVTAAEWLTGKTLWGYDLALLVVQGLAGCLIAFMFFFSTHPTVGSNWLVVMLNPLPIVCAWWVMGKERRGVFSKYHAVAAVVTLVVACGWLPQYLSAEIRIAALCLCLRSVSFNLRVWLRGGRNKSEEGRKTVKAAATVALMLAVSGAAKAQNVPKIVVNVTIDGLRSDYLQAFEPLYGEGGFKLLLEKGRVYEQAGFPHARLSRAAGVATVQTGTVPYNHGIVDEYWLDRETLKTVCCVDDDAQTGILTDEHSSAQFLRVSTVGDELKVASDGTAIVYSFSPFKDAAVLGAGHAADGAFWINNLTGKWCGTEYYGTMPAWVRAENESNCPGNDIDKLKWEPLGDLNGNFNYFITGGLKTPFSYSFKGNRKFHSFVTCGLVNEYVSHIAATCIERSAMGTDETPDYMSVCYYAGEFQSIAPKTDGDRYGEIQDTYVRLDKALANLMDAIDAKVGMENALVVVTSTGPNDAETTDLSRYRIPSGTFYINRTAGLLNLYLGALYGKGQYVEGYYGNELYFNLQLLEQKQLALSDVLARAEELLLQSEGVKDVYTSSRLLLGAWTPGISQFRNSYCPGVSGDVMIQVAPGWKLADEIAGTEKLIRESNILFPIIFFGGGVTQATSDTAVTTDQIAPTLTRAMRIRTPNACTAAPLQLH